jgi:hypothetical protein
MSAARVTNEQEFQGQVLTWINEELRRNPGLGLDRATQEPSKITRQRNDLVIWTNRAAEEAFLTAELKTPSTLLSDPKLLADACTKAQRWDAPFFFIWNMQGAELYRTPAPPAEATPNDRLVQFPADLAVKSVEDWLKANPQSTLRRRALDILDHAWRERVAGGKTPLHIDASIFVDRLSHLLRDLREHLSKALTAKAGSDRETRKKLRQIAAVQGFVDFVENIDEAIAGQYAYRVIGQILFYYALRRRQSILPELVIGDADPIPASFEKFWNEVRRFDYEALFKPGEIDEVVPVPVAAQKLLRRLVRDWSAYDWSELEDDVLGSIFERLIPAEEQMLLGQFYTPRRVADLLIAFAADGSTTSLLDPGCGSGTFLMRGYSMLEQTSSRTHAELLSILWGFDVSAFAAELAVINLCRQDFTEYYNFPRIISGDFFDRAVGEQWDFPPAKAGAQQKVAIPIPLFDTIVGNPPYLRSQHQDDLDAKYKGRLFGAAQTVGVKALPKTDMFAFFVYHGLGFLRPGGRLGFVTSASWLTSEFGSQLQRTLLEQCKIVAIVWSARESFFSQVDINTVLIIAEKRSQPRPAKDELIRFVTLKAPLADLWPDSPTYWTGVHALADEIESHSASSDTDQYRVHVVNAFDELTDLKAGESRNWSAFLRAPATFFELFGAI